MIKYNDFNSRNIRKTFHNFFGLTAHHNDEPIDAGVSHIIYRSYDRRNTGDLITNLIRSLIVHPCTFACAEKNGNRFNHLYTSQFVLEEMYYGKFII